jgi:membrane-bound lytic murein transglycosylase D
MPFLSPRIRRLLIAVLLALATGCKSFDYLGHGVQGRDVQLIALYGSDRIDTAQLDKITIKGFSIHDFNNPVVQHFITGYQTYGRQNLLEILGRAHVYLPFIFDAFKDKGVPADLAYLPIIESSFDARAVSYMQATGLWQFMYGTGRMYGLDQNYWYDDRMDPRRSTVAAAYMFKWLFQTFDNWLLALAAYNSGPGTVAAAIQKTGSSNYWELCRQNALPRETRDYVPKFIAATFIAKNPEKYGFPPFDPSRYQRVKTYTVDDATDLGIIAQCAAVPLQTLQLLNPALRQWATPPMLQYPVHLPEEAYDRFSENYRKIPVSDRVTFRRYLVRMGDNLTGIAGRYGIPVNPIAQINRFKNQHFIQAGESIIIPIRGLDTARQLDARLSAQAVSNASPRRGAYTFLHEVEDGESLYEIALRYSVEIFDLFEWNELSRKTDIMKGKLLVIKKPIGSLPRKSAPPRP